jgi:hypothetical protein
MDYSKEKFEYYGNILKEKFSYEKTELQSGFAILPIEIVRDSTMKKNDLRLYSYLLYKSVEKGFTWIGNERLASELDANIKTIKNSLLSLENKGMIYRYRLQKGVNNHENRIILPIYGTNFTTKYGGYKIDLEKTLSEDIGSLEIKLPEVGRFPEIIREKNSILPNYIIRLK